MKMSLLTALESSAARAEQIARQTAVFGRVLDRAEIVDRIDRLTLARRARRRPQAAVQRADGRRGRAVRRALSADRVAERLRTG